MKIYLDNCALQRPLDDFLKQAQQLSVIGVCVISPTDFVEEIAKQ